MQRTISRLKYYLRLAVSGDLKGLWNDIHRRIWSQAREYEVTRDLRVPHTPPKASMNIKVVPLTAELAARLFQPDGLDQTERRELADRRRRWDAQLGTAYVALDDEGIPCFVGWTVPGSEMNALQRLFPRYDYLSPDDLLFTAAWTIPHARGHRIMGEAVSRAVDAASAARPEYARAVAIVDDDNEPSLRGLRAAGFEISAERITTWRFGRKRVRSLATPTAIALA